MTWGDELENRLQDRFTKSYPNIAERGISNDMMVMNDEIFGPVLPIVEYDDISEALSIINSKDRPLGLYYFGNDKNEENNVMDLSLIHI